MKKRVPPEAKIIGQNLRNLRMEMNLSQHDVATHLGVSSQQVQKYESGQNRFPIDRLYTLKKYLGISYEHFFEGMVSQDSDNFKLASQKDKVAYEAYMKLLNLRDNALKHKICLVVDILSD